MIWHNLSPLKDYGTGGLFTCSLAIVARKHTMITICTYTSCTINNIIGPSPVWCHMHGHTTIAAIRDWTIHCKQCHFVRCLCGTNFGKSQIIVMTLIMTQPMYSNSVVSLFVVIW